MTADQQLESASRPGDSRGTQSTAPDKGLSDLSARPNPATAKHPPGACEERFRWLSEAGFDGIVIHEGGEVLEANEQFAEMFGYRREEIVGADGFSFVAPEDRPRAARHVDSSDETVYEVSGLRKDGSLFPLEVRSRPFEHQGKLVRVAAVRDITERKRGEEALRRSEEDERAFRGKLTVLHEVANELSRADTFEELCRRAALLGRDRLGFERLGLWFLTDEPATIRGSFGIDEQGNLRDEREMTVRVTAGSAIDQLLTAKERFYQADDAPIRDHRSRTVATGSIAVAGLWDGEQVIGCLNIDTLLSRKPITDRDCELLTLYASTIGHLCSRRRAEDALAGERNLLHALMEQIPDQIYFKTPDHRFTRGNDALAEVLGLSGPEEVVGKTDHDLWPAELADLTRADEERILSSGQALVDKLERNVLGDGTVRWVSTTKSPVRDRSGVITGLVGITRDVTERHLKAERLDDLSRGLRTVVRASDELLECDDVDTLCRRAVELARERLGLERCSLYLFDQKTEDFRGTYGTDRHGRTSDEHGLRFEDDGAREQFAQHRGDDDLGWVVRHDSPQSEWCDGRQVILGEGWVVRTPLRSSLGPIGVFYNDNALTGAPLDKTRQEIVAVYCSVLANLIGHKRTLDTVRRREQYFRSLIEHGSDYIAALDLEGTLRYGSPSTERLLGYGDHAEHAALLGENVFEYIHPGDRPGAEQALQEAVQAPRSPVLTEFRFRAASGEWHVLEAVATRLPPESGYDLVVVNARDITARRRAEAALRDSEERHRELAALLPEIVFETGRDGTLTFVNEQTADITGYSRSELRAGFSAADLIAEHDRDRARADARAVMRGRGPGNPEYDCVRKDGSTFPVIARATPIMRGRKCVGVRGLLLDISERKEAEALLRETNRRLEHALEELRRTQQRMIQRARLAALGQMAAGVAHDFNNTLTPVVSLSDLLLRHPDKLTDRAGAAECLELISTAGKDGRQMVLRLLAACRPRDDADVRVPVNLRRVIEQAVDFTRPRWRDEALAAGVAIQVDTPVTDTLPVVADETELREVFTNIILNSVDAILHKRREVGAHPDTGEAIAICARTVGEPLDECEGAVEGARSWVEIELTDTGLGMTPEIRERCLDPLFSTKGERGVGMGLSLVHGIVIRHEGTLAVASTPRGGTTVTVRLPVAATDPVAGDDNEGGGPEPSRPLRILLVDDERPVRESLTTCLQQDGHTVEAAADCRTALRLFEQDHFDLVVTDSAMPDMRGEELAGLLRRSRPGQPIFLVTGFRDDLWRAEGRPPAVDCVLDKPVTLADLRWAIEDMNERVTCHETESDGRKNL